MRHFKFSKERRTERAVFDNAHLLSSIVAEREREREREAQLKSIINQTIIIKSEGDTTRSSWKFGMYCILSDRPLGLCPKSILFVFNCLYCVCVCVCTEFCLSVCHSITNKPYLCTPVTCGMGRKWKWMGPCHAVPF